VEQAIALIDQLIEQHKQILQKLQATEQAANDVGAMIQLDKAKEDFVPGRFSDQKQGLQSLQKSLEAIDNGLQKHFNLEEKRLLTIFEQYGSETLASGLRLLILEHQELKDRIAESKKEVAELVTQSASREVREGKAWGVRVYISHTRKLIEAHAQSEQELFHKLRAELMKARK
jgi:hemerythrin-like domain-containing protein